jgi:hypothetical protein
MDTHVETLIIGAGMSGRIAKLLCPEAVLVEASPKDKFRCALFAGPTALYERVGVLKPERYDIVMGWCPDGFQEAAEDLPFRIRPVTRGALHASTLKKLPWMRMGGGGLDNLLQKAMSDRRSPERMSFRKEGWNAKIPEIEDILWGVRAEAIDLDNKAVKTSSGEVVSYGRLVVTAPLPVTMKIAGMNPDVYNLVSAPLYYRRQTCGRLWEAPRGHMYVEYVPHAGTSVFRRTLYVEPDGSAEQSWESSDPLDGGSVFWPGVIKQSFDANRVVAVLESKGVFPAGRFARWDPNEHIHTTEAYLKEILT